jgi:hypothetical protein
MLADLLRLAQTLQAWADQHRDAPLAEHEHAVLTAVRTALPSLLTAVVQRSTRELDLRAHLGRRACPRCGTWLAVQSWRPRQIQTACGPVRLSRPWFYCRPCRQGFSPVDVVLDLKPGAHLSTGLRQQVVELGAATTFAEAERLLAALTGQHVAAETIRHHTEQAGATLETEQQAQLAQVQQTGEAAVPVEAAPGRLLVEADGVMVRFRDGWHEAKVGIVAGWDGEHAQAPSYVAAREGPERFGPRLLTEAARRGALAVVRWEQPPDTDPRLQGASGPSLAVLREVQVLGDGAAWIWHLAAEHFGQRTELVDWYHSSQHLWTAGKALQGDGTAAAAAWVRQRQTLLWERGADALLGQLRVDAAGAPTAAQPLVQRERGYFAHNRTRLDYAGARAAGRPTGSGAVESACKHLVQHRLKRPGARWSDAGGQALLTLRAHLSSGRPLPPPVPAP